MQRQYIKWYSPSLHREMELLAFGDRGFPVVVFPTSGGRFFEYEDRGMVNALRPKIDRGELQVICVDSVDQESWYNRSIHPADRLHRQNAFDAYLVNELAPFVRERTSWPQMATAGVAEAVLIRAVEIDLGEELMRKRRPVEATRDLTNGPGKLCQAMDIDRRLDGVDRAR